jgi:DNA topoisomerase-1
LEENGIGRPSTYAAILSTIQSKGYVKLIKRYFHPTELGRIVNHLLIKSFPDLINVHFTAKMEDELDRVEAAHLDYQDLLHRFYASFKHELDQAQEGMLSMRGVGISTGFTCPECKQHKLHVKMGKNGHYLACNGYPACSYTQNYERDEQGQIKPLAPPKNEITDEICETCGKPMVLKQGRYGPFLACSGYPACKTTRSLLDDDSQKTGVNCPQSGCEGVIVTKKTKRGKLFYGCNRYPDCKFALWDKPVPRPCPVCGSPFVVEKSTKKDGNFLACPNKDCGFKAFDRGGDDD